MAQKTAAACRARLPTAMRTLLGESEKQKTIPLRARDLLRNRRQRTIPLALVLEATIENFDDVCLLAAG